MKEKKGLPMYGVGPLYVGVIAAITVLLIVLHCTGLLSSGALGNSAARIVFYVFGGIFIAYGVVLWVVAVLVNRIDKDIAANRLRTTGIYAAVRNPIYAAFLFACTGALMCCANWWLLPAPFVYYLYLTALMIFTEEKWLRKTFGAEYDAYCKRVNRCIPWIPERSVVEKEGKSGMKELYETKISDAKWIACDIPANVGWIAYTACLVIAFVHYGEYPVLNIVGLVPAALILLGIAELVSERIEKLDRVLPRARLLRGFGALTLGCGSGVIVSLVAVILNFNAVYLIMLIGSAMCFLFAALLFSGYKKKEK